MFSDGALRTAPPLLSQSLRGSETGHCGDADTCPQRLHEGEAAGCCRAGVARGPSLRELRLVLLLRWPARSIPDGLAWGEKPDAFSESRGVYLGVRWGQGLTREQRGRSKKPDFELTNLTPTPGGLIQRRVGPGARSRGTRCPAEYGHAAHDITGVWPVKWGRDGPGPPPRHTFVQTGQKAPSPGHGLKIGCSHGARLVPLHGPHPVDRLPPQEKGTQRRKNRSGQESPSTKRSYARQGHCSS